MLYTIVIISLLIILMSTIEFGDNSGIKAHIGDRVHLKDQVQEVIMCRITGACLINIDGDKLKMGDLAFIKKLGLTISNPDTGKEISIRVDYLEDSWGHKIKDWLEIPLSDDNDDSIFFSSLNQSFLGGGFSTGKSSFGSFGGKLLSEYDCLDDDY